MNRVDMNKCGWVGGVSDGLSLPCGICGNYTAFDYIVTNEIWRDVAPQNLLNDVICLPCFDKLATEKDVDISEGLLEIQFTGKNKTVKLQPTHVYFYKK